MSHKANYSIVYISPDSRLGDRVAIGMLILKDNHLAFRYSMAKLRSLKTVLVHKWDLVQKSLLVSQKYIENINLNHNPIFNEAKDLLSIAYLEKLSIYSNGIVQYQEPRLALLSELFDTDSLFNSFFPEEEIKSKELKINTNKEKIDTYFIKQIASQVHVNIEINKNIIPSTYFDYHIDAVGKNGVIYIAKYFDFHDVKAAPISHLFVLNKELASIYNQGKLNKVMVFGEEPEVNSQEHLKWEFLHHCEGFELHHPDDASKVADRFLEAGAKKFLGGLA